MTFGEFLRNKRLDLDETLRAFSKRTNYDIGYISRIENGFILPPLESKKLEDLARAYKINDKSMDLERYYDLAAISRKSVPKDLVIDNPEIVNYLPAFLRTAAKKNITKADVEKLLKVIKEGK